MGSTSVWDGTIWVKISTNDEEVAAALAAEIAARENADIAEATARENADDELANNVLLESIIVESPGPITTWDISHPFDHNPSVEIRDTTDRVCIAPILFSPGVVHIDISPSNISLKAKLTP